MNYQLVYFVSVIRCVFLGRVKPLVHEALGGYSYTVQLFLLNINVLCRRTSMYNRSTTEVQVPSASCTRGFSVAKCQMPRVREASLYLTAHKEVCYFPKINICL